MKKRVGEGSNRMQHLVVAFMNILAMYQIPPLNPRDLNAVCLFGGVHKIVVCLERAKKRLI